MAESTWGTVYLEDIPTVTLMSELLRRRKCASKPEKRLVFIGPPGSRTETLSPVIKDEFCLCHLTINNMIDYAVAANTPLGLKAREAEYNRQLISEDLRAGIMDEALKTPRCQKGFVLDGFPGTLKQAEKIDEMLNRRGTPIDKVFYFAIDDSFLEERSSFGRWLPAFYKEIQPVIDHYTKKGNLVNIPAGKTPEEAMKEVKEVVSTI